MKTYAERKALGLIPTAADRREAQEIASRLWRDRGNPQLWERAARIPALYALTKNHLYGNNDSIPTEALEEFYRDGDRGIARGGKVWRRPVRLSRPARDLLAELKSHDVCFSSVDERVYAELRDAGFASVVFGVHGNHVFATSAGRAA